LDSNANLVFLVENDEMDAFPKGYNDACNDQPGTFPPLQPNIWDMSLKYETIAYYSTNVQEYR